MQISTADICPDKRNLLSNICSSIPAKGYRLVQLGRICEPFNGREDKSGIVNAVVFGDALWCTCGATHLQLMLLT